MQNITMGTITLERVTLEPSSAFTGQIPPVLSPHSVKLLNPTSSVAEPPIFWAAPDPEVPEVPEPTPVKLGRLHSGKKGGSLLYSLHLNLSFSALKKIIINI